MKTDGRGRREFLKTSVATAAGAAWASARARSEQEVLEDPSLQLVVSAAIPDERGPLAVRAMRHGKDVMVDKPAMTTLEQLAEVRRAQAETRRIFSVDYSERFSNGATVKA